MRKQHIKIDNGNMAEWSMALAWKASGGIKFRP